MVTKTPKHIEWFHGEKKEKLHTTIRWLITTFGEKNVQIVKAWKYLISKNYLSDNCNVQPIWIFFQSKYHSQPNYIDLRYFKSIFCLFYFFLFFGVWIYFSQSMVESEIVKAFDWMLKCSKIRKLCRLFGFSISCIIHLFKTFSMERKCSK